MSIEIGQKAPDFKASATGDKQLSLADFSGRWLVLYFYPRDNTPGCTQEGESFRDLYSQFQDAGADVVGVSRDSLRKHENFRAKYDFPFDLISDADESLCTGFDVLKEKNMYGRTHVGIERSTFLIDGQGMIRQIWRAVKVTDHAQDVLQTLRDMNSAD